MAKRKKTARAKAQYPGIKKKLFSRIKQEFFEGEDYASQLTGKEKAWLAQFNEEYLGANLTEKKNRKYNRTRNLHNKSYRKSIFDSNNQRNRDIFSRARAAGLLNYGILDNKSYDGEEILVELIDLQRSLDNATMLKLLDGDEALLEELKQAQLVKPK